MSDNSHEEEHTGPIKTPKQLLITVFFSFVAPVIIIIGLVYFVVSDNKPAAGAVNLEKAIAARIQKVGAVEIRDANREIDRAKKSSRRNAQPATRPAQQVHQRSAMQPHGAHALQPAWKR